MGARRHTMGEPSREGLFGDISRIHILILARCSALATLPLCHLNTPCSKLKYQATDQTQELLITWSLVRSSPGSQF